MLYDLDFLKPGAIFPPRSELMRLETYRQNKLLFEHRLQEVFSAYLERIRGIVNKFADVDWTMLGRDIYSLDFDYFELLSVKTADLVVGESPTITVKPQEGQDGDEEDETADGQAAEAEENLKRILEWTSLDEKLIPLLIDISRYGDAVVRAYTEAKRTEEGEKTIGNFTIISPEIWFPVVDREVKEHRLFDGLAWVGCENPEEEHRERQRHTLHAQVHAAGKYTSAEYELKEVNPFKKLEDGSECDIRRFKIVRMIGKEREKPTGFDGSAIQDFHNVTASDCIFGINDYDRICAIIAELGVRYTLEGLILDRHTAPTMAVDEENFFQTKDGRWTAQVGGVMKVGSGGTYPQYITWDASLQANHTMIEKLEKHLYSLSEMGAVLNDDSFGASQGFEALETRMTNARLKARRLGSLLVTPLKKLIATVSEVGYAPVKTDDLSVKFHDGLPITESRRIDLAVREAGGPIKDVSTVLQERFGKTKKEADAIAAAVSSVRNNPFETGFFNVPTDEDDNDAQDGQNSGVPPDIGSGDGAGQE